MATKQATPRPPAWCTTRATTSTTTTSPSAPPTGCCWPRASSPTRPARRARSDSGSGDLHPADQDRAHRLGAVVVDIGAHGLDAAEHVLEVAGDRDLLHREGDLAVLHPEATGAARVVAGHVVHALPHQLDDEQARAQLAQHLRQVVTGLRAARRERQVV